LKVRNTETSNEVVSQPAANEAGLIIGRTKNKIHGERKNMTYKVNA
jgi:hypothetical protein